MRRCIYRWLATVGVSAGCMALPAAWAQQPGAVADRFTIARFEVRGNSILKADEVIAVLRPFTGHKRNFGDVQRALEALETVYHDKGFTVVQVSVPEQELSDGTVVLQVLEPRMGYVGITGNQWVSSKNVRDSFPDLKEGQHPNIERISATLRMANENPFKRVTLKLKSAETDDKINAELQVEDRRPWKVGVNLDNTGSPATGSTRMAVSFQHGNVMDRDHLISLQYATTVEKPDKVSVYGFGYRIPLYSVGDSIDLFGGVSSVDSGSVTAGLLSFQVSGEGSMYGVRYNHNMERRGQLQSKLIGGLDAKIFKNSILWNGSNLGNEVGVYPASVGYTGTWARPSGQMDFYLTYVHNLEGGANGARADLQRARTGAPVDYNLWRWGVSWSHGFKNQWQMRLNFNGQQTDHALIPGEQFGAGGATSVRGFTEREISNDSGAQINAEAYAPPAWCSSDKLQCRLLAFYDYGYTRRNNALAGELADSSIASVGVGTRLALPKYVTLQMDFGRVVLANGSVRRVGDDQLHVMLNASY